RDYFPLTNRERVIHRQWDRGLRRASRLQNNWRGMVGHRGTGREKGGGWGYLRVWSIGGYRHRGGKGVPVTIPCLNEALRLPSVADDVAYGLKTVFNRGITDCRSRPYLFTQFLLWNHTVAVRQEIGKYLEHFWSQSNRLASPAQEIALRVE